MYPNAPNLLPPYTHREIYYLNEQIERAHLNDVSQLQNTIMKPTMNVHTPIEPESTAGQKIGLYLLHQNNPYKRHAKSESR